MSVDMFEKLFVPVDLSPQSLMMVNVAVRMEEYGLKEMVVYSTLDHPSKRDPLLKAIDRRLKEAGVRHKVMTEVRKDHVSAILKAAETTGSTMIAMAASGKGRVREFFVGSTSLGVIRRSELPVLLDKFPLGADEDPEVYCRDCPPLLDSVLVTVDLTKASKHLLPYVQEMIDVGAKKVTLLHVVRSSRYSMADDRHFASVKERLESYRSKLVAGECKIDVHMHFGTTTYNILEAAREVDATLIVLGTARKTYLRGAALGSTSEEVVKGSTQPVLLVPS